MKSRLAILSLGAALTAVATTAGAEDRLFDRDVGPYVGVGIGYGTFDNEDFLTEDNELRDDRMTWQAFAGAKFTSFIGLEAGYVDFGEADGDGGFLDANGLTAALALHLPVHENFTLSLRGGQLWWDAEGSAIGAPLNEIDFDADGEDPFYGAGLHFGQDEGLGFSLRYDMYELDDTDIEVPSLNLELGF